MLGRLKKLFAGQNVKDYDNNRFFSFLLFTDKTYGEEGVEALMIKNRIGDMTHPIKQAISNLTNQ